MNKNQKFLLIILSLYVLGDFVSVSITNLYLWQLLKQFYPILVFNSFVFAAMAISGLFSSVLGAKVGNKNIFIVSMVFYAMQFILLAIAGNHIPQVIMWLGIISGIAIGSESYSYNVLSQQITLGGGREKFFGLKTSLLNAITLVGVPVLTFLATFFHSYTPVFLLSTLLVLLVAIFTLKLSLAEQTNIFHMKSLVHVFSEYPDAMSFIVAKFLFGIQNGLFWVVLGIVTLQFVGNLFLWGIFSSFLTLISIIAAYNYGRMVTFKTSKYFSTFGTYAFAAVTIFLATNWNFVTFVVYQIILIILNVIMAVSFDSYMASIIEEDKETEALRNELNGIGELVLNLGRFTPMLILLLLHISFENNLYLRIAFTIVAPLPLFIMSALRKTPAFSA